jgi:hypothetical protein
MIDTALNKTLFVMESGFHDLSGDQRLKGRVFNVLSHHATFMEQGRGQIKNISTTSVRSISGAEYVRLSGLRQRSLSPFCGERDQPKGDPSCV